MSDYQPNPGDEVLLTIRATVGDDGDNGRLLYDLASAKELESRWMDASLLDVVSVEPAPVELPTLPGAVIRAECRGRYEGAELLVLPGRGHTWKRLHEDALVHSSVITRVVEVLFPGVEP